MPEEQAIAELELPKEIRSHSSELTNLRLIRIFEKIDFWKAQCWVECRIDHIEHYFAETYALFDSVFFILDKGDLKKILAYFKKYWQLFHGMADKKKQTMESLYNMRACVDCINRGTKASMQQLGYFFKHSTPTIHDVGQAVAVLETGGSIFGGNLAKAIQEIEDEERESSKNVKPIR